MFGRRRSDTKQELWKDFETEALPFMADLYRLSLWLTRNTAEAEDLVQETLAEALKSYSRYERETNCRAWLTTIMYRLNLKRIGSLGRIRLVGESEEKMADTVPFEPPLPQTVTDEDVIAGLKRLPDTFRQVVVLSDIEEFSYKDIALVLGIPIGTVMSRLYRGRKLLRIELSDYARSCGIVADEKICRRMSV